MLTDLRALDRLLAEDRFERGVSRIGAEQEMFLVDHGCHPAPAALKLLEAVKDSHFTTELGLFQIEMNADPQPFAGRGLHQMEVQLAALLDKARTACAAMDVEPVLVGILPTIGKTDLGLHNMVPNPRYMTLNLAMNAERGGAYDFSIKGIDELNVKHDSVMVEACNASFQVHLQLAAPDGSPTSTTSRSSCWRPRSPSAPTRPCCSAGACGPRRASRSSSRPATSAPAAPPARSRRARRRSARAGCTAAS